MFLFGCSKSPRSYPINVKAKEDCLKKFGYCDSLFQDSFDKTNSFDRLLYAKWLIRKEEYQDALKILDSIEIKQDYDLGNEIEFNKLKAKSNLRTITIQELDEAIGKLTSKDKKDHVLVDLLLLKSSKLRELAEINYSFATSMYAESLRLQLSNIEQKKVDRDAWTTHITNLLRQEYDESAKYYLENKIDLNGDKPQDRWFKTIYNSLGKQLDEHKSKNLLADVINRSQFTPKTDRIIIEHIGFSANNEYAEKLLLTEVLKTNKLCTSSFYSTLYLVDSYLSRNKLDDAKIWIDSLSNCNIPKTDINRFLILFREQHLLYLRYKEKQDHVILEKLFNTSIELFELYSHHGKSIVNDHFADAIFRTSTFFIEAIYEKHSNELFTNSQNSYLGELQRIKALYNKISDNKSILGNKIVNDEQLVKISRLKYEIEKLELSCNRYKDSIIDINKVAEPLYKLHEKLFLLKSNLKENSSLTKESDAIELTFENIPGNTLIIEFYHTEIADFITFLSGSNFSIKKLDKSKLSTSVDKINQRVKLTKENLDNLNNQLTYLDSIISMEIDDSIKHVFFVPDNEFYKVPFETIMYTKSLKKNYLLSSMDISYLSSIQELKKNDKVFIKPNITAISFSDSLTLKDRRKRNIHELPLGYEECIRVSKYYSTSTILSGNKLTQYSFINELENGIVHISSHSKSSGSNMLDNYIYVRNKTGEEEPLYGFGIKTKRLPNSLVILSSCESGTGTYKPGAGVFSLSRDFLQAGAQTVIKSLWAVNEASTAELMVDFHKNFTEGYTASMALTLAKRKLKQNPKYAHPYYWAGFVLEGNPNVTLDLSETK